MQHKCACLVSSTTTPLASAVLLILIATTFLMSGSPATFSALCKSDYFL